MQFISTRGYADGVSAAQAIVQGLAQDGGLFVPDQFPQLNWERVKSAQSYSELAAYVLSQLLPDYSPEFLQQATTAAYGGNNFAHKAGYVQKVADDLYSLELWHGPTCAFKDYALQLMPHLLVEGKRMLGRTELTRILVATSGDTGKAALEGYKDLEGIEIDVFYPNNGTSEIQRLQMTTQKGANVGVFAVQGNFDDAQSGVKRVFADSEIAQKLEKRNIRLSSANSINWGRLAPQIVYYFFAYRQLVESAAIAYGQAVDFCVPTGNFGDILAGYYAKQMGLPVGRLVCASNQNNVLNEFLKTGRYDARRTFYRTTSPSMDILVSSNLERLLYHATGNSKQVKEWMQQLAQQGWYQVDDKTLETIQQNFAADWCSEEQTAAQLNEMFNQHGYLCDTHTAVAFYAAAKHRSNAPMVVLSTASPFKFPQEVLNALQQPMQQNEFEAIKRLEEHTGTAAPKQLTELCGQEERFAQVIEPEEITRIACE